MPIPHSNCFVGITREDYTQRRVGRNNIGCFGLARDGRKACKIAAVPGSNNLRSGPSLVQGSWSTVYAPNA